MHTTTVAELYDHKNLWSTYHHELIPKLHYFTFHFHKLWCSRLKILGNLGYTIPKIMIMILRLHNKNSTVNWLYPCITEFQYKQLIDFSGFWMKGYSSMNLNLCDIHRNSQAHITSKSSFLLGLPYFPTHSRNIKKLQENYQKKVNFH